MKKQFLIGLISFIWLGGVVVAQDVNIKINPSINWLSGEDDQNQEQFHLTGLGLGAGVVLPFHETWYYNPMLLYSSGGQGYKSGDDFKYGICNSYLNFSNTVGYRLPLNDGNRLNFAAGPSLNYWAGARSFSKVGDDPVEKDKIDLKNDDNVNRAYLSAVTEVSYTFDLSRFDLSVGIRGDWGLTPIESYEDINGEKTNLKPQSVALTLEVSNPWDDLTGKYGYGEYGNLDIELDPFTLYGENTYEQTTFAYREARKNKDRSLRTDDPDSSKYYAEQALEWLRRAEEKLKEGITEWSNGSEGGVGPTSAEILERFIESTRVTSQTMRDSVWIVPEEPAVAEDPNGDDPRDTPPPTIYGEEVDPPWIDYEGVFEPSQGVWQDDINFVDQPTKQLTRDSKKVAHAELDLVANRWTGVYGTREGERFMIEINGKSTYSQKVSVRARLKLIQGGKERILWTDPKSSGYIPIEGPSGAEQDWDVAFIASSGSPINKYFKMDPGNYRLELDLVRMDGKETGIVIATYGEAVVTSFPVVNVVPVSMTNNVTVAQTRRLRQTSIQLVSNCERDFDRYFPIPSNSVKVSRHPVQNQADQELGLIDGFISLLPLTNTREEVRQDRVISEMVQRYATQSQINSGKVVVLVLKEDWSVLYRDGDDVLGFAPHQKVVFMNEDDHSSTPGHEVTHTLPLLWSKTKMEELCKLNYHNNADKSYAQGARVEADKSEIIYMSSSLMGSALEDVNPTQCTFWHLTDHLQSNVDPKLYLVRGYVYYDGVTDRGIFDKTFEIMGEEELIQGNIEEGGWGIVLQNDKREQIVSFPFEPHFKDSEEGEDHKLVAFNHRINRVRGTRKIMLIGPSGILDSQIVSKYAPSLKLISPEPNSLVTRSNGKIRVEWEGSDKDGDELRYLVYYAPDGESWRSVSKEQIETFVEFDAPGKPMQPTIKVICTDGVRSDEKVFKIYISPE